MDPTVIAALVLNLEVLPAEEIRAPREHPHGAHHHLHVDPPDPPRYIPPAAPVGNTSTLDVANTVARRAAEARRRAVHRAATFVYTSPIS